MANGFGKFVLGFWIGAVTGATAALLWAPAPGDETRKQLQDRGIDLSDQVRSQAERLSSEARVRAQEVAGDVRDQVSQAGQRGRIVISEGAKRAQQAVETVQSKVTGATAAGQEA